MAVVPNTSFSVSTRSRSAITNHNNHSRDGSEDSASVPNTVRDQRLRSRQHQHRRCSRCLLVLPRLPSPSRVPSRSATFRLSAFLDVHPVILGTTSYFASAKDGASCKSLRHVCKYKLGSPTTFSTTAEKKFARFARRQTCSNSYQTKKFIEQFQILLRREFR